MKDFNTVVFGQYGSSLKDNIFHQSAQDRLWMGLAAGDAWWVNSPIGGAAISINQHTRVDTTTNATTIIIRVDTNIIVKGAICILSFSQVSGSQCNELTLCSFVHSEKFSDPRIVSLCLNCLTPSQFLVPGSLLDNFCLVSSRMQAWTLSLCASIWVSSRGGSGVRTSQEIALLFVIQLLL